MLSSIGRAAVRRVVTRGPQSTNRALQSTWQFQRVDTVRNADNASSSRSSFSLRRLYATATATATKAATKSGATKTTTAKPKTKKTAAKKPAKKPVKKVVKKKAVPKKKPAKKTVKKVLTDKQKAKLAWRKNLDEVKALKATALVVPKGKPATAWMVLLTEYSRANPGNATLNSAAAGAKYKSLGASELESYNHTAAQNKAENEAAYKKWVESHTPDQIRLANNARRALRSIPGRTAAGTWQTIIDPRLPKQPVTSHAFFVQDRYSSGDLKGIAFGEASKLLHQEFKALSAGERQAYVDREAADRERYIKDHQAAFGRAPEFLAKKKASS